MTVREFLEEIRKNLCSKTNVISLMFGPQLQEQAFLQVGGTDAGLKDHETIIFRPSGTEPKLKAYIFANGDARLAHYKELMAKLMK